MRFCSMFCPASRIRPPGDCRRATSSALDRRRGRQRLGIFQLPGHLLHSLANLVELPRKLELPLGQLFQIGQLLRRQIAEGPGQASCRQALACSFQVGLIVANLGQIASQPAEAVPLGQIAQHLLQHRSHALLIMPGVGQHAGRRPASRGPWYRLRPAPRPARVSAAGSSSRSRRANPSASDCVSAPQRQIFDMIAGQLVQQRNHDRPHAFRLADERTANLPLIQFISAELVNIGPGKLADLLELRLQPHGLLPGFLLELEIRDSSPNTSDSRSGFRRTARGR